MDDLNDPKEMHGSLPDLGEPVVEVTNLSCWRNAERPAVGRVSFVIRRAELLAILGGPGAGKTTIVDSLMGFLTPTAGRVRVCGTNPSMSPQACRRYISFVDRSRGVDDLMTAVQNLEFFARLGAPPLGRNRVDAIGTLRRVGVADRHMRIAVGAAPAEVALATALAIGFLRATPVLVLDDPTAGLDSRAIDGFVETMELFRTTQTAILLTTSDVLLAGQLADRIGVLKEGQILVEQARPQLLGQSLTEFAEQYLGRVRNSSTPGAPLLRPRS